MRRHACAILFVLATNAVAQGQLFFQEEVDALVKDVNQMAEINRPRPARQEQQGYDYPKPTSSLPIPFRAKEVQRPQEEHHEEHHHDDHHGAHSHIHVTRLDVTCDARGMSVELAFDGAFNGIVYSKGHYKNRNCRYINKDSARGDFNFVVPMDDCGTIGDDKREDHETILIIQNEESVQEVWDSAKRVRCPTQSATSRKKITKTVSFNPFTVQRLVIDEPEAERAVEETKIECWMDILVGKGPCGSTVQDKVKIGEQLNAMIYIKDGGANYDILVKDCYAHDSENLNAPDGSSIQLSDDRGCPRKEKLMGLFQKTQQTCSSGADLVAFAPISAFKFADRPDVFLTCVVELCPGGCDQCPDSSIIRNITVPPPAFKCTPNLVGRDPRCPRPTLPPFSCTPELVGRDSRCPAPPIITRAPFVTPSPRPPPPPFSCTANLVGRDPRCPTTPPPPFSCTPNLVGRDSRCPAPPVQFRCTSDLVGTDPRCPAPITNPPPTRFFCTPELVGQDSRCPAPPKVTRSSIATPTPRTTPIPFTCTPNLIGRDPRCPTPPPPPTPFSCTPELIGRDRRCPSPQVQFRCTPALVGNDPRCPAPSITPSPPPRFACSAELRGKDPRCKPAHCEFDPAGPGCGITQEQLNSHPFHIGNSGPLKPRKRITGSRPTSIPHSRRRRDTSKNIVITGVGTGIHFK